MSSSANLERLHARYVEQAAWTHAQRDRFLPPAGLTAGMRVLEVGAGTGAVIGQLAEASAGATFSALDLDPHATRSGAARYPALRWHIADAHALPYRSRVFEAVFFHFVLLWLTDPAVALREAARVTQPGGRVLAFAEPDHAGRIDFPDDLAIWGKRQAAALESAGADVHVGRKLRSLFAGAGLEPIASGIVGAEWLGPDDPVDSRMERETLRADLADTVPAADLDRFEAADRRARERGERVLFVPTFYAVGRVR